MQSAALSFLIGAHLARFMPVRRRYYSIHWPLSIESGQSSIDDIDTFFFPYRINFAANVGFLISYWYDLPSETVAYTANGLNKTGIGGIFLEFFAQPAHMHIYGARITDVIVAPYILK